VNGWRRHGRGARTRMVAVLDSSEAAVVRGLVGQIRDMLAERAAQAPTDELVELTGVHVGPSTPPTEAVMARLLPDFSTDDKGLSAALRSLREPELIAVKESAAELVLETCPVLGGRVELSREQAETWLTALNDVRLALGVALEVTEDMPEMLPDDDPRADHLPVYHWLTWVQDSLVTALAR